MRRRAGVSDFRSDTVTLPTSPMRRAMADAEVGDDFYGEDPTVTELERRVAELTGTDAALLVISGGMANLVAILATTTHGEEVVAETDSDLVRWEAHSTAAVAGVQLRTVGGVRGVFSADAIRGAIGTDTRAPRGALVAIENTHSASGGTAWTLPEIEAVTSAAAGAQVSVLCDGARLPNAAVASGYRIADAAALCDMTTLSLYKGLGAPMGALVCGDAERVDRARWARRLLGGTFRQMGVMAAAGLVALSDLDRLRADHDLARQLADGLRPALRELGVGCPAPTTNIVTVEVGTVASSFVDAVADHGVLVTEIVPGVVRFVTHRDVNELDVQRAVEAAAHAVEQVQVADA